MYYSLFFLALLITIIAQAYVTSSYNKYLKKRNSINMTGAEVARKILDKNGLANVKVNINQGLMSDHYDPKNKCVNLSNAVYNGASITSLAVAAHECGHAIQDKDSYGPLKLRHSLIPFVTFSSYAGYLAIMIGIIASIFEIIIVGIILECVILLFELITLPVEFNASSRALKQLGEGYLNNDEVKNATTVLRAAALTYVASTANTAIQILRLVLMFGGRRRD